MAQMTQEAAQALQESIEHWKENVERAKRGMLFVEDIIGEECSLCQLYSTCAGCPVAKHAGKTQCVNTPWIKVRQALSRGVGQTAAAESELAFLEQLAFEPNEAWKTWRAQPYFDLPGDSYFLTAAAPLPPARYLDSGEGYRDEYTDTCLAQPPGHLDAPGWLPGGSTLCARCEWTNVVHLSSVALRSGV